MRYSEFEEQLMRLKITYGEKTFPEERKAMFWKRYEPISEAKFSLAVDMVVLRMPTPNAIVDFLDEQVRNNAGNGFSQKEEKENTPINPNAKELAEHYVPLIKESMKKIGKQLPYDKAKRTG